MAKEIASIEFTKEFTPGNVKEAMAAVEATSRTMYMVPRKAIKVIPGFNVRVTGTPDYNAHIESLADSMVANGFYPDKALAGFVAVERGKQIVYVAEGHCRLAAADIAAKRGADLDKLPVIIKPAGTSKEDLLVGLVQGNTGKPFTPYEQAIVAKRLSSYGMEDKTIAERLGITTRYLADLYVLVSAPAKIRNLVIDGKISATQAVKTIKANGEDAAEKIEAGVAKAAERGKTKATGKDVADTVPMEKKKFAVAYEKGSKVPLKEIDLVKNFSKGDWWAHTDEKGTVEIAEDIKITVTIERPKKSDLDSAVADL